MVNFLGITIMRTSTLRKLLQERDAYKSDWGIAFDNMDSLTNTVAQLKAAGTHLYDAGNWVAPGVTESRAKELWQNFRDALGLVEGHNTARTNISRVG